jgi:hypothetical protein
VRTFSEEGFSSVFFCTNCGSSLYAGGGDTYYVAAGALKDVERQPSYHMMVAYNAPWDVIGDIAPQYPESPPDE